MPDLKVGQRVRLGEIIGPTGNSGISGKGKKKKTNRRPAIHFSAFFSESSKYAMVREIVVPVDGRWMDPIALYRQEIPVDSRSMKALSADEKGVPIPVIFEDNEVLPPGTKFVWPYMCERG
jgi:murein DD-endopeptidase MepM/ murein hydrolase activator NlpD